MGVALWQFQPNNSRRNMHILSAIPSRIASFIHLLKRIFYVRRLLIANSLRYAPGMPISYHKYTVRLAEHMINIHSFEFTRIVK